MASGEEVSTINRQLRFRRTVYFVIALSVGIFLLIPAFGWTQERLRRLDDTRTHEGPLEEGNDRIVRASAVYLLRQLPPLDALHGDGLRIVLMPSFNRPHFAIAIFLPSANSDEAVGVLKRFDQQNHYAPLGERQFRIPAAAYRSLAAKFDQLTDGWRGDTALWTDGTGTAFERVRGRNVTSGIGNSPDHYDHVAGLTWKYLERFAPGDDLPKRSDWEPSPDEPPQTG